MWFLHCLQEFGIEKTNKINKAAIKSMSFVGIHRIKNVVGFDKPIENYDDFKMFFEMASKLMIPDFMNVSFGFDEKDQMTWSFDQEKCFAYAGVKRMGVIDRYECCVLYRIKCWLKELGIKHKFNPEIGTCHMHHKGHCSGKIQFY